MYLKITNGQPTEYSIGQLKRDNPNVSFPREIPNERLAEHGVFPYTTPARPAHDSATEEVRENGFVQDVQGNWSKQFTVVPFAPEVSLARRAAQMQATCRAKILEVADELTQMNLSASYSANRMTQPDEVTYLAGLDWKDAMIAHCRALATDPNLAENWPVPSADIVALAGKY